jgi:hypothetical protein
MEDFKGDYYTTRATDRERKKYDIIKKKYVVKEHKGRGCVMDRRFFHISPVTLDVCNGKAHLYGMIPVDELIILPEESGINSQYHPKIIQTVTLTGDFRSAIEGVTSKRTLNFLILNRNTIGLFNTETAIDISNQPVSFKNPLDCSNNAERISIMKPSGKKYITIDVTFLI